MIQSALTLQNVSTVKKDEPLMVYKTLLCCTGASFLVFIGTYSDAFTADETAKFGAFLYISDVCTTL
jgi:hypothetical protein